MRQKFVKEFYEAFGAESTNEFELETISKEQAMDLLESLGFVNHVEKTNEYHMKALEVVKLSLDANENPQFKIVSTKRLLAVLSEIQ